MQITVFGISEILPCNWTLDPTSVSLLLDSLLNFTPTPLTVFPDDIRDLPTLSLSGDVIDLFSSKVPGLSKLV